MTFVRDVDEQASDVDEQAIADGLSRALAGDRESFDRDSWRKLAASGWLQMLTEGSGDPAEVLARLISPMEQWGATFAPGPILLTVAWILPVLRSANSRQLADEISSGLVVTATREATSVAASPTIRAVRDQGSWRLSGHARLVPWLPDADKVLVTASTGDNTDIVACVSTDGAGVARTAGQTVDPGVSVGDLILGDALAETVIGADIAALRTAGAMYSLALDAQAVGGAADLITRTVRYVTERRQFGQPVGSFQAVKHRVADMLTATEAARALLWLAAERLADRPGDPPWEDIDASRVCSGSAFRKVAGDAIQCHGGMGFTWEQGLHLHYRRALIAGSLLGDVDAAASRLVRYGLGLPEVTA
jgi:alkylation response protein AidB-like acyl-CoA dehydrogenase